MKKNLSKSKRNRLLKQVSAAGACLLALSLCTGCGAANRSADAISTSEGSYSCSASDWDSSSSYVGGSSYDGVESVAVKNEQMLENGAASGGTDITVGSKLIKTVDLEIETKEYEQLMSALEEQIYNMGGYIEDMDAYNGSNYSGYRSGRYAYMTIRIPAEQLNLFMQTVSDIGNIVRRHDRGEDVTLSYADMEGRRNTLRTEQSRLLAFLDKAESIEDIIAIEERLSNVRYQLESMESRLKVIDNQVEYSTVNLNVNEVKELSPAVEQTAWERISEGFSGSLRNIGDGIVDFGIWIVINIPYFIIWAAVITVFVLIIKRFRRKRLQKKLLRKEKET